MYLFISGINSSSVPLRLDTESKNVCCPCA